MEHHGLFNDVPWQSNAINLINIYEYINYGTVFLITLGL